VNLNYVWVVLWVAVPVYVLCGRASRKLSKLTISLLALGTLLVSLVFDNLIVGLKIVAYDPGKILGIRVPIAPIEDFGYTIVGVILVPVLWNFFGRKQTSDD
jgi:small toxic polypeptide LdrA/B/C/D